MIKVDKLTVRFGAGQRPVVRNVSLNIEKGTAFGLVGESGCGKSTVLRALSGLNANYDGTIELDGELLSPERDRPFFRRVQMVFQDPYGSLHPRKTILAQLKEPFRNQGLSTHGVDINAALRAVGLDPALRYRFPHQLSGGQRQRVAIARALMLYPDVLLLDEPTSALDVSVQAEILNLLEDLRKERGLTYLLVSHDLAVVSHMCNRVAIMQSAEIVEEIDVDCLRRGDVDHPYSQRLLQASRMYGKEKFKPTHQ
jgi:peptide/nickel transport system ATP-binding protein